MSAALRLLFVAYVAFTAWHIGHVLVHEPFAFDAWNVAADTNGEAFSVGNWLDYGVDQYTHGNPRVGQWFTYLAYKLEYFAVIATPIAYLALALAITVLGLGRWPTWKRGNDVALFAITLGVMWFALPKLGVILFNRAYSANYVYGATIQLWFLAVLRLRPHGEGSVAACIPYWVLGVFAGASNEHTGPTLVIFTLAFAAWRYRHNEVLPKLALTGALGVVVGFAMLFFAPGGERYDGLGTKVSLVGRFLQRGFDGNLDIVQDYLIGAAPIVGLALLVLIAGARDSDRDAQKEPLWHFGWALVAGALITVTLFVSPKVGPRMFLAPCALLVAAFIGLADSVLSTPRRLAPVVALAVLASIYASARTIPLYSRLSEASVARLQTLYKSKPGTVVTVDAFDQIESSWWFLGDDFRAQAKRDLVSEYYGLQDIVFRAMDVESPLGVTDARFKPIYTITPASCLDQAGGLQIPQIRGFDVASTQRAAKGAIERLRVRVGEAQGRLDQLDLVVDFIGARPPLPRPTLLVGRWKDDAFEAYAGLIERDGSSRTRVIHVPKDLKVSTFDIFIYSVGHDWKELGKGNSPRLAYEPWHRGPYWALACTPTECFVIAATRML